MPPQPGGDRGLDGGRPLSRRQVIPYIVAQLIGAIVAALLLYAIAKGAPGFDLGKGFATNGYAEHSPGHYDRLSALLTEVVMTMLFLFVIMGSTHGKAPAGFAPLAIGLCLTLIHLVSIPVTNTSVNPARSPDRRCSSAARRWHSYGCSGSRRWSAASSAASFIAG